MKPKRQEKRLSKYIIDKITKDNNPPIITLRDYLYKRLHNETRDATNKRIKKRIKKHISIEVDDGFVYVYCKGILIEKCYRHGYSQNSNYSYILDEYGL